MANKTANRKSTSGRTRSAGSRSRSSGSGSNVSTTERSQNLFEGNRDYKEILKELVSNPAVKYVAGGLATAIVTKIANNLADRYPEISSFIKENLDSLEGKFGDFKGDLPGDSVSH